MDGQLLVGQCNEIMWGRPAVDPAASTHTSVMNDSDAARVAMADPVPVRREV